MHKKVKQPSDRALQRLHLILSYNMTYLSKNKFNEHLELDPVQKTGTSSWSTMVLGRRLSWCNKKLRHLNCTIYRGLGISGGWSKKTGMLIRAVSHLLPWASLTFLENLFIWISDIDPSLICMNLHHWSCLVGHQVFMK